MNRWQSVPGSSLIEGAAPDFFARRFYARAPEGSTVRLFAVGDIGFSGRIRATAKADGHDTLLGELAPLLCQGDIVFGNLEYPLTDAVQPTGRFASDPGAASALARAGFHLIHLANNHVAEYGQAGLTSTLFGLRAVGLIPLGAGADDAAAQALVRTDRQGIKIGWLGCGRTLLEQDGAGPRYWEFDEAALQGAVAKERGRVDVLIVSIHIGLMYLDYPRPEHKEMAERLMQAGADLIVMHHAHVLQGVQVTSQNQICCYNLGNLLLDWQEGTVTVQMLAKEQNEGAIFAFDIDRKGIASAMVVPTYMDEARRVHFASGERGRSILDRLERISRDLEGDFRPAFERQRAERNTGSLLEVLAYHAKRGNWRYVWGELSRARPEHAKMLYRYLLGRLRQTARKTVGLR